ncbi:unnamed protein product [Adineta steineri]|uniref:Ribosome-recycling factor, mitochondrial n=1 Tax=Adineta steineri TaxID=433720 RepID=A0A819RIZ6_9BILA|nr:unnamed protein product [Adineta steineri]
MTSIISNVELKSQLDRTIIDDNNIITKSTTIKQLHFRTYKNFFVICIAFLFQLTAFDGIGDLQSSLNTEADVGVNSLSIIYACLVLSSIFLPHPLIAILGLKWATVISQIPYLLYVGANYYPKAYVMYLEVIQKKKSNNEATNSLSINSEEYFQELWLCIATDIKIRKFENLNDIYEFHQLPNRLQNELQNEVIILNGDYKLFHNEQNFTHFHVILYVKDTEKYLAIFEDKTLSKNIRSLFSTIGLAVVCSLVWDRLEFFVTTQTSNTGRRPPLVVANSPNGITAPSGWINLLSTISSIMPLALTYPVFQRWFSTRDSAYNKLVKGCMLKKLEANYYSKAYIMYPAAALVDLTAAPLWTAKCGHFTDGCSYLREAYSNVHRNLKKQEKSLSRDLIADLDANLKHRLDNYISQVDKIRTDKQKELLDSNFLNLMNEINR